MHVELAKLPMDSFKDLAKHYLMIVLGIVTALGLEAWIEHIHHRHAAETASAQIEAEIRQNLSAIQASHDHDVARENVLKKIRDGLIADIKSNASAAVVLQHIHEESPDGIYLDWRWPALRHEAWDVAVANQSAGWMDRDKLRRYATIYAAQSTHTTMMTTDVPMVMDGPRMMDSLLSLDTGDIQPRQLLQTVNQMWAVANESEHNLTGLAREIQQAMPAAPAGSP